jgi:hypothetical protein
MNKKYNIYLDGSFIGYTHLEKSDAPMGVVFGRIYFEEIDSPYEFFIDYCNKNNVAVNYNDPKLKLIDTQVLDGLLVLNDEEIEIVGFGISINGMDDDEYIVEIVGIENSLFSKEFPQHLEKYNNLD